MTVTTTGSAALQFPTHPMHCSPSTPQEWLTVKRRFFVRTGLSARPALRLHRVAGLWERRYGVREWRNVSEHCLVEAARVTVFAGWLGLSAATTRRLALAAAAHDFFTR